MGFYTGLSNVAKNLIKSKGALLTFTRRVVDGFDPTTGETLSDPVTYTANGVAFNYKQSEINGSSIIASDLKLIIEAIATVPIIGDNVAVNSVVYRIKDVKPTNPAGTAVIYELQVRK